MGTFKGIPDGVLTCTYTSQEDVPMLMLIFAVQQVALAGLLALVLLSGLPNYVVMLVITIQALYVVQYALAHKD